ncbi:hypothetical protein D3C76_860250 [compost metagenome]
MLLGVDAPGWVEFAQLEQHGVAVVVSLRADIGGAMLCSAVEPANVGKQLGKQPRIEMPEPVGHLPAVALGRDIQA